MQRIAFAAAVLVMFALPSSANAARAELVFDGMRPINNHGIYFGDYPAYVLRFVEAPGEVADVRISTTQGYRLEDPGHPIEAGLGCAADDGGVTCSAASVSAGGAIERVDVDLGDGNDVVQIDRIGGLVKLGDGDDTLTGTAIFPGLTVEGGLGTDSIETGTISYASHPSGVAITRDGIANDGLPGENENVRSGSVIGSPFDDVIDMRGTGGASVDGRAGDDTVMVGSGRNWLWGGAGDDKLLGGDGQDNFYGGSGNNLLDGGAGDDGFFASDGGADGHDSVIGGSGTDGARYEAPAGAVVTVSLDDEAGDGLPGENDNIRSDVEDLQGGPENDHFVGSNVANSFYPGDGSNVLEGNGGDDRLRAHGDKGTVVNGGAGRDHIEFVGPDDAVNARDGEVDSVICSGVPGYLDIDPGDLHGSTNLVCVPGNGLPAAGTRIRIDTSGRGRVPVNCPATRGIACAGTLKLVLWHTVRGKPRSEVLASQPYFATARSMPGLFTFKLTRRWRLALDRKRKIDVGVQIEQNSGLPLELRTQSTKWRLLAPPTKRRR